LRVTIFPANRPSKSRNQREKHRSRVVEQVQATICESGCSPNCLLPVRRVAWPPNDLPLTEILGRAGNHRMASPMAATEMPPILFDDPPAQT
jgi:hypothetical protein